mmetsp:Transcript_2108/g.5843  ORF Transcript_2108/g.5843 Transcript_2108/m.5843 type:complete len:81 (+) Transcript_2108:68-310(+)
MAMNDKASMASYERSPANSLALLFRSFLDLQFFPIVTTISLTMGTTTTSDGHSAHKIPAAVHRQAPSLQGNSAVRTTGNW